MNWYLKVLRQYADFSGRARRTESWIFTLIDRVILISLFIVLSLMNLNPILVSFIAYGYAIALFIPTLAVSVRRLHDVGKSGWMLLVGLIPIIGGIWLLILWIMDGDSGENKYGINPKEVTLPVSVGLLDDHE